MGNAARDDRHPEATRHYVQQHVHVVDGELDAALDVSFSEPVVVNEPDAPRGVEVDERLVRQFRNADALPVGQAVARREPTASGLPTEGSSEGLTVLDAYRRSASVS